MLNYTPENNWANRILGLASQVQFSLEDENISNMSKSEWKSVIKRQILYHVFNCLSEGCHSNRKIVHLRYNKFKPLPNKIKLGPYAVARVLIKARLRMFEVKVHFKNKYNYILNCPFCVSIQY